ncbi:MAG TPA: D-glycero-beta-D-manno-heptose-7-phosphate kinase [Alphaproteobacteria bacterium]|nr:bifunctional heptose 7-phosphate kinase/heptose 1-phosphate adenyltransferase [Rhodospirillaceae bacterium]HRJ66011.1 D-glycero-beta-D-manno-heptose-7-phosphate kinase [Alphaproteobacteria bacterium]
MTEHQYLIESLSQFKTARVLCIGDVMMDRFVYGSVERISPEAPIPVFLVDNEKHMLGGAGNVVANIAALGAGETTLLAVVGDDINGREVAAQLASIGVKAALATANDRFTTVKSRFVSGGQQMLRVDREKSQAIGKDVEAALLASAEAAMADCGVVILSDYNKGVLTDSLIAGIIAIAQKHGKPVVVDPKGTNFARYRGATVITPNRKELETATGMKAASDDDVRAAAMKIIIDCGVDAVLATRSKDGMSLVSADKPPVHIAANVREVFDVSGAGDTVIAAFATAIAAGVPMLAAAEIANIAAGIVVGKIGTATTRPEEIIDVIRSSQMSPAAGYDITAKIMNRAAISEASDKQRALGRKIGFTNGCFDLLHPGHLSTLAQAKATCDYLVVAINSDASVKRLKGPTRPVQDERARSLILSALGMVDAVIVYDEDTPIETLKAVKPDFLIKGGQYKLEEVVGYDLITSWGGQVVRADMEDGFSTTNTIAKMAG